MKKVTILFLLIFPTALMAQSLRFSLLADPQFSWMVSDTKEISSSGAVPGINAGLGMDYYFADNYAFSTGVTINNIGGKLQYSDTLEFRISSGLRLIPARNTVSYNLQYITVPIGLKFKTNEIGYTTFFTNLGVSPMVNIRTRVSDSSGALDRDNIEDEIMLFNMNYFINLGVQYSLGGSAAIIGGLGYSSGFVDVTSRAADAININTFTIKLGILF